MTSTSTTTAPTAADLDAARLLLDRLGVSPADLITAAQDHAPAPTFADCIPVSAPPSPPEPAALRQLLEPDHRALGHPAARRTHPHRDTTTRRTAEGWPHRAPQRPRRTRRH
jgi:hypothetical protein